VADLLVTGTDTGVGKTVIAAALVRAWRARGVRALGFKPVETGLEDGACADSEWLARASAEAEPLALPLVRLAEPLAPAVAAERAGVLVRPEDIEARVDALGRAGYSLVIEGAGGVMVPLCWEKGAGPVFSDVTSKNRPGPFFYTVLDLAARCGLDAVVVGRAGLGTLNHVMMTVAMLRARQIPVRGVVLNGRRPAADLAETTNPAVLARLLPDILIIEVPHHAGPDVIEATVPYMRPLLPDPQGPGLRP
jgi:dethiobiotin synthetase